MEAAAVEGAGTEMSTPFAGDPLAPEVCCAMQFHRGMMRRLAFVNQ